jgi:hypothetical protein
VIVKPLETRLQHRRCGGFVYALERLFLPEDEYSGPVFAMGMVHKIYSRGTPVSASASSGSAATVSSTEMQLGWTAKWISTRTAQILFMQEAHASVCAVRPQHTGCTLVNATTDSCDSQSHGYVKRRQSSAAANAAR